MRQNPNSAPLCALLCSLLLPVAELPAQTATPPMAKVELAPEEKKLPTQDKPLELSPLLVTTESDESTFDKTGMGTMELEMGEPPFSNDLLAGAAGMDEAAAGIDVELSQIANPTPADLSASTSRVDVRGFPTPRLRNGFTQLGINEVLNIERSEQIVGPLTAVSGRSAPGGISNYVTGRPRAKPNGSFSASASTLNSERVSADFNRVLKPNRAWARLSGVMSGKSGPENYGYSYLRSVSSSATWRATRASSFMVQVDHVNYRSNPSGGMPEYRATRSGKILGPYLPLAEFHTNGPLSGQRKQVTSAAIQYEGQLKRWLSMRATAQVFSRRFFEDRFTKGEYLLDEGVFTGTREPQHTEQPMDATSAQIEGTARFRGLGAEHKVLLSLEGSQVETDRLQRAIATADREAYLPETVRRFNPYAPDYYRPGYSPSIFSRLITDRGEDTSYRAVVLSERAAFAQGKIVATAGLRQDWVNLRVEDRRPKASTPLVEDNTGKLSWHAGANYVVKPGRLLVFANSSTAFEPSLRVDSRTGRIQGNETTFGYETGATGLSKNRNFAYTLTLFTYFNRNIARRNPLYGSPIYDADQTQPQLVSAGEERFRGAVLDLRWRPVPSFTASARATSTKAITTASPDLPEEVGRQLTRLPKDNASLSLRYAPPGLKSGFSLGGSFTYIGPYTAWYESSTRAYLHYPGYTQVSLSTGLRWTTKKITQAFNLGMRNALNTDLLKSQSRIGAGREASAGYTLSF